MDCERQVHEPGHFRSVGKQHKADNGSLFPLPTILDRRQREVLEPRGSYSVGPSADISDPAPFRLVSIRRKTGDGNASVHFALSRSRCATDRESRRARHLCSFRYSYSIRPPDSIQQLSVRHFILLCVPPEPVKTIQNSQHVGLS
ncbi:hypothetical protein MPTK1_6g05590 [Marchantia polymorpha subsp. ruderalis]|uniref:Uncharacterized protein n=2 Tax=Marchantia polymorpha TaxID=3197 RepID=A0AAF6BNV4_MARPO|nr:hypothetical protein MARPO_0097s0083 [Marchantia polymorpha]BBN13686.1 hypothetical protein Mp_6g05590 [Marchantia polymorpha subsp. ruderalis]PTQ32623.1 hypothetical protein MARPO_0097s0083 [Marchantia polymorpha]PTQ32624.1 hypothetical protein MARPO_0097s0083 [Marchantia polymorpha]BBN13687.1 hypothetical protein Mp_6g05590 [Marchantia polymorpha subsp. ruderalis]|eukprot:PTQ32622.1 hypothetical protein MARPO_0097s0083 [Marchantia polymorpha]